jgi:hypothetical protein
MKTYFFFFTSFILISVSFLAYPVLAQNILPPADPVDFDSYENGNLNGQDGWSDAWNSLVVQDVVTFAGDKAIKNQAAVGAVGYKELSDEFSEKGVVSVKVQIEGNSFSDNQNVFGLYKGMSEEHIALFRFGNNFDNRQNMLLLSIAESADVTEVGQITQGEWHKISIAWRNSDFNIRLKVDNNDWTEWFPSQTTWNDEESLSMKIALPEANKYGNFYLDDIKSFIAYEEPIYDPVLLVEEVVSATTTDISNVETLNIDSSASVINAIEGVEDANKVIISDTNVPTIVAPISPSDETVPSITSSEPQTEQSSVSADTDDNEIITAPF